MEQDLISITEANYTGGYSIELKFNDSSTKTINFETFLLKSHLPKINKYLDKGKFKRFLIVDGNLNWNGSDLVFTLSELHEGKVILPA